MKIHLNQIAPDGTHFEGEEAGDILAIEDEMVRQLGPVRYAIDAGLSEGGLFATGTLAIDLELACVTCLERFNFPLTVDNFAVQMELTGNETVDLTPMVREDILLALPPYPHCDWDGSKACNGHRERFQEAGSEPLSTEIPAWDELDKLKIKSKK